MYQKESENLSAQTLYITPRLEISTTRDDILLMDLRGDEFQGIQPYNRLNIVGICPERVEHVSEPTARAV